MAHIQYMDELIKEYLVFRGFGTTIKAFDVDLKNDKERSFRVDKIIEQLLQFINCYDLNSLRDLWGHLENHMFTKLESNFIPAVKKLENSMLKLYLVNAITNNKTDKVNEFFIKMTSELQTQSEWKDWFVIPFIKNPEENSIFAVHFTKQWQDILIISLHNLLASIFQYMPTPALMHYQEDIAKIRKLEERHESLKSRLAQYTDKSTDSTVTPCQVDPPQHLLDDFYIIAQENVTTVDNQAKTLRGLISNMSTGLSPVLGRKESASGALGKKRLGSISGKSTKSNFYES